MKNDNHREVTPKLRFPEFRKERGWAVRPIGDYLTESRIPGSNGKVAKRLTVKLWGKGVIAKAKTACEGSGNSPNDHFVGVNKMIDLGKGAQREVEDIMLTEHVSNNQAVRQTRLNRGIRPESLPPSEDVKKVERRLSSDEKKALQTPEKLEGT
jgi:hypothetical protein